MADGLDILLSQVSNRSADIQRAERANQTAAILAGQKQAKPEAIVLVITVATCQCGRVHRLPNPAILVRYGDKSQHQNSIHHRRQSLEHFMLLPHEKKELLIDIAFCEDCF
jgi:hypothetical protein